MFTGKSYVNSLKDLEGRTVGIGSVGALAHQLILTRCCASTMWDDQQGQPFVNIGSTAAIFRAVSAAKVPSMLDQAKRGLVSAAAQYPLSGRSPMGSMAAERCPRSSLYQGSGKLRTPPSVPKARTCWSGPWRRMPSSTASSRVPRRRNRSSGPAVRFFPPRPRPIMRPIGTYVQTYKPLAVDLVLTPQRIQY